MSVQDRGIGGANEVKHRKYLGNRDMLYFTNVPWDKNYMQYKAELQILLPKVSPENGNSMEKYLLITQAQETTTPPAQVMKFSYTLTLFLS